MDHRPLGRTGLDVSAIGVVLDGDAALAVRLAHRARAAGVNLFAASPETTIPLDGAFVLALGPESAVLRHADASRRFARCRTPEDLAAVLDSGAVDGILVPFSMMDQSCADLMPAADRRGWGLVGTSPTADGALRGPIGLGPRGALVNALRSLEKPGRSLAQAAVLFALANDHLDSVLVAPRDEAELEELLAALSAPPLEIGELEHIFETYAHRFDEDPAKGCGGPPRLGGSLGSRRQARGN